MGGGSCGVGWGREGGGGYVELDERVGGTVGRWEGERWEGGWVDGEVGIG